MDDTLSELVEKAVLRGSRYVKGQVSLPQLPGKIAELGVFLLEKARTIETASPQALKTELIEIQQKIDDLRKDVFNNKLYA
ncbi:MAG: hypothetical protein OHK006_03500 [Thermodesulfovibrionales bacterium]